MPRKTNDKERQNTEVTAQIGHSVPQGIGNDPQPAAALRTISSSILEPHARQVRSLVLGPKPMETTDMLADGNTPGRSMVHIPDRVDEKKDIPTFSLGEGVGQYPVNARLADQGSAGLNDLIGRLEDAQKIAKDLPKGRTSYRVNERIRNVQEPVAAGAWTSSDQAGHVRATASVMNEAQKLREERDALINDLLAANKKNVSVNLIRAIQYVKKVNGKSICIVGKNDGFAYSNSNLSILVEVKDQKLITPISETFQVLLWHLLVSHPKLQMNKTKW